MQRVSANFKESLAEPLNLEYRASMMPGRLEAGSAFLQRQRGGGSWDVE